MKDNSQKKKTKFIALNDYVQIEPIIEPESLVIITDEEKKKPSKGKVLSVGEGKYLPDGTLIKPSVNTGDIIVFNPHMVSHELEYNNKETLLVSSNAIYGKYN